AQHARGPHLPRGRPVVVLARHLAESMADGQARRLPRLTDHASSEFARDLLAALYRLRDAEDELRLEEGGAWTVRERVAAAAVRAEICEAIDDARAWLSCIARRGGRGLPAAPAPAPATANGTQGVPGCRGGAPAVMGHGCPALAPAVGPAPA